MLQALYRFEIDGEYPRKKPKEESPLIHKMARFAFFSIEFLKHDARNLLSKAVLLYFS